jgi:hypothetical protein
MDTQLRVAAVGFMAKKSSKCNGYLKKLKELKSKIKIDASTNEHRALMFMSIISIRRLIFKLRQERDAANMLITMGMKFLKERLKFNDIAENIAFLFQTTVKMHERYVKG